MNLAFLKNRRKAHEARVMWVTWKQQKMTVRRKAHIESRVTLWSVYILYFLNIIGSHWRALSSRVTFLWIFIRKKKWLKRGQVFPLIQMLENQYCYWLKKKKKTYLSNWRKGCLFKLPTGGMWDAYCAGNCNTQYWV